MQLAEARPKPKPSLLQRYGDSSPLSYFTLLWGHRFLSLSVIGGAICVTWLTAPLSLNGKRKYLQDVSASLICPRYAPPGEQEARAMQVNRLH
jgi:hypothetical protein